MTVAVKTLDQISREKQRDVLYLTFEDQSAAKSENAEQLDEAFNWEDCATRKKIIQFMDKNQIPYQMCFMAQPTNGTLMLSMPYRGELYIDIPYDESNPCYKKLESFLENPDGSMKLPNVKFWYYPLEEAMKNAEHDEPGFWDNL